ncbi:MAG: DUF222 domain-containing protein, partial [Mycobacterium sp.]
QKSALAARQARLAVAFDLIQRREQADAGMPAAELGAGVGAQIALARRESPARGGRLLGLARALVTEMPHTLAALETGQLNEWRATLLVKETACLSAEDRAAVDAELAPDTGTFDGAGDRRIIAAARAAAYRRDPRTVTQRASHAATERNVSLRPAPDTMCYLTALLPVAAGVAVYAGLTRHADTLRAAGDPRTRGQLMADTLVERTTGHPADQPTPIAVNLVLSDETLMGGSAPAMISDYGPIPAEIACRLIERAVDDPRSRATLRKLYAKPSTGALVAMESRSRRFPKGLALFIKLRDQRCRTPYCDAPVRHTDHSKPWARGGSTSSESGLGLCEQCNYLKEADRWQVVAGNDESGCHKAEFITPTGQRYHSDAPPTLLGCRKFDYSEVEQQIRITLWDLHAA